MQAEQLILDRIKKAIEMVWTPLGRKIVVAEDDLPVDTAR